VNRLNDHRPDTELGRRHRRSQSGVHVGAGYAAGTVAVVIGADLTDIWAGMKRDRVLAVANVDENEN